jgi:hypothetical protein
MVLLYQSADWRNRSRRCLLLLLLSPSSCGGTSSCLLDEEVIACGSSRYLSVHGRHYLFHPRLSAWKEHLSLEQQHGDRSPHWLWISHYAVVLWEVWLGDYAMMLLRLYKQRSLSATAPYQFFFMCSYIVLLYYVPIYFQSILVAIPIKSGVSNLLFVLTAAVFALVGGAVVMKTGRAQQVMFFGSVISTVAVGLIYTLDIGSSTAKWVGYHFFTGASMVFAIIHGLSIAQAHVGPEDLAAVTANLLCMYPLLCLCEFIVREVDLYSIQSSKRLEAHSAPQRDRQRSSTDCGHFAQDGPGVNPSLVLLTGASELHNVFPPDVLPRVLEAYMIGLKAAFAVAVTFCGIAVMCSLAIPMKRLPSHAQGEAAMRIG